MTKKLLITLGVLFVIVVIAARVIPSFISEDRIKTVVTEKTEELLGYDITINGALNFRIFPVAGVYMEDVTIGKGTEAKSTLATFKSMKVDVETLALLNGDVIIKNLLLNDPIIQLVVDKSGKQNWKAQTKDGGDTIYRSDAPKTQSEKEKTVRSLSLEDVRISNGLVTYRDERSDEQWQAKNININISLDDMDSPFEVDGRLEYNEQSIQFSSTFGTLSSFLQKQKAEIDSKIKSAFLSIEAKGKIDGGSYSGITSLSASPLPKAIEWLSGNPLGAKFSSALPMELSSITHCSPDQCNFSDAKVRLASIEATGKVKTVFNKNVPAIEVILNTNELDLDLFKTLPQQASTQSLFSSAHAADDWSTKPMNFDVLRAMNLIANINAAGIKVQGMQIGKTLLRAKIERSVLSMDIVDAEFYQGKATVIATVDASKPVPRISKQIDFRDVQMEPFLKDAQITDRFKGKSTLKFGMNTSGKTQKELVSNMDGNGSFNCSDGSYKGANIAQMIRNVQSAFKDVNTEAQTTDFSEITGTFTMAGGVLSNQDMVMKAPLLRASGKGTVNLPLQTINYRIEPEVVETAQGQGGKDKKGLGVPVLITGPLDAPRYHADVVGTIKNIAENPEQLKETVKDVKSQIKAIKKGDGDAIKGLLGGFVKQKQPAEQPAPAAQEATPATEEAAPAAGTTEPQPTADPATAPAQ
ncbi:MAG: AsmA family protein [Alphaproteobacteria bacterium]